MKRLDIFGLLKKDMNYIENELFRSIEGEHQLLNETSMHLLKAGGKRLRPVFVLMGGSSETTTWKSLSMWRFRWS